MTQASTLRPGAVVRMKGEFLKVVESDVHQGGGRAGAMVHAKLRNLATGAIAELRFEPKQEVDVLAVERTKMQYLYQEGGQYVFMNQASYDQTPIPADVLGPAQKYLRENEEVEIEFFEGKPLSARLPEVVELTVASTGSGVRGATKPATLENGVELLVPDFIKQGDKVRIETATGKYLDRAK
jgi:elongation factor P